MKYLIDMPNFAGRHENRLCGYIEGLFDYKITYGDGSELSIPYDNDVMDKYVCYIQEKLLNIVRSKDTIFFIDGWTPIIPTLYQHFKLKGMSVKMIGMFHNSSSTNSFMKSFEYIETCIIECLDSIVVPSDILYLSLGFHDKSNLIRYPIDTPEILSRCDVIEKTVVFPFNLDDPDRRSCFLDTLAKGAPDYTFYVPYRVKPKTFCSSSNIHYVECLKKVSYFETIRFCEYVVSVSMCETYGLSMLESLYHGCKPLVLKSSNTAYSEYIDKDCIFPDLETLLKSLLAGKSRVHNISKEFYSILMFIKEIKKVLRS